MFNLIISAVKLHTQVAHRKCSRAFQRREDDKAAVIFCTVGEMFDRPGIAPACCQFGDVVGLGFRLGVGAIEGQSVVDCATQIVAKDCGRRVTVKNDRQI